MKQFRNHFNIWGPLLVLALRFLLDPDSGFKIEVYDPTTTAMVVSYLSGILIISGAFWLVKLFLPYKEADTQSLFSGAQEGKVSCGLGLIARMMLFGIFAAVLSFAARAESVEVRTYIPAQAKIYVPMLKAEQVRFWPDHPRPEMLAALGEQESCLYLTHPKCWDPASKLQSARELGGGIFQLTAAFTSSGAVRFDALKEMVSAHPELRELSWNNLFKRADLQIRAGVLKVHDDFKYFAMITNWQARLDVTDAAYNSGRGNINKRRQICGMKAGCHPQQWFGHLERINSTGNRILYGTRTAFDITNEHVKMVSRVRSPKYRDMMS